MGPSTNAVDTVVDTQHPASFAGLANKPLQSQALDDHCPGRNISVFQGTFPPYDGSCSVVPENEVPGNRFQRQLLGSSLNRPTAEVFLHRSSFDQ